MICQIAKKELHHNLYSIRFPALMVISAVLFILNGILAVTEPVEEIPRPRPSTVRTKVYRQPNRLSFCVRDSGTDRVRSVLIVIGYHSRALTRMDFDARVQLPSGERLTKYALPQADDVDWMFIIKIVFSLFAIIFTFDAVCRERANGTLTLMCSNPVSRSSVLLGKYLGACGTLLIPLIMGLILNLLIISVIGGTVSLQTEHWVRMALLVLASIVYISLFVLLGLLTSAAVRRTSTSLLILLTIWVAMIIIYPNLSGIATRSLWKVDSLYEYERKLRESNNPRYELRKRVEGGTIKTQEQFDRAAEEAFSTQVEIFNNVVSRHQDALMEQCRNGRRLAMLSPAAVYEYTGEAIADAGFERQQRFLRAAEDYSSVFQSYIRGKLGEVSYVPSDENIGGFRTRTRETYKGDLDDFPYFTEPKVTVIDSLRLSLINLSILFLWNALFFVAAHYIFVKRSLR